MKHLRRINRSADRRRDWVTQFTMFFTGKPERRKGMIGGRRERDRMFDGPEYRPDK